MSPSRLKITSEASVRVGFQIEMILECSLVEDLQEPEPFVRTWLTLVI